jgi:hypothetical protein
VHLSEDRSPSNQPNAKQLPPACVAATGTAFPPRLGHMQCSVFAHPPRTAILHPFRNPGPDFTLGENSCCHRRRCTIFLEAFFIPPLPYLLTSSEEYIESCQDYRLRCPTNYCRVHMPMWAQRSSLLPLFLTTRVKTLECAFLPPRSLCIFVYITTNCQTVRSVPSNR